MYDDTPFIINSDHGGLSQYHGRPNIPEMTVPWIVYTKKDILQSGVIPDRIKVYDSAPTLISINSFFHPLNSIFYTTLIL
ncbi:hypothetical protein P344_06205 [Spiroplasma mirum ATCC 29335]|uniref:Uncharacterized protein n=1 Tax=Spiroplasma mirum ATCC 29335 TaxID=838561 RepID=W6AMJ8_9MOLU|nr:hypothetical protein P344_06205 [Spiroplasma mirum ATCC 29335]AKM53466.1 hypothetical protein SATRI_v1c11120 [Spiroplasma atrichopogonis]